MNMMLDVRELAFDYPDKPLLQGVCFTVHEGCLLHLRGGNGMGKTTLLKLLAGILQPTEGNIYYQSRPINDSLASFKQQLCFVGHRTGISQLLTVRENCKFELHQDRCLLPFDALIQSLSLQGLEDVICATLSMGQQRRVGLLRLLMSDASLWLLDEPLVALDKEAISALMTILHAHLDRGGQVVLTSHQQVPLRGENYQEYCL